VNGAGATTASSGIARRELARSREGRGIFACELGESGGLLLFGAIHGDEPESAALCTRFLDRDAARALAPLTVVTILNPDGFSRRHKDNAAGVDLNRNFAASSWQRAHPPGYDPGPRPLSEPESAALAALVEQRRPRVIVAVHQPFACVNWDGPAEALATRMGEACALPTRPSIGYPTPGSFGSWAGVDRGLSVITLELAAQVDAAALAAACDALLVAWEASA
jgi:murein peptide amidase A